MNFTIPMFAAEASGGTGRCPVAATIILIILSIMFGVMFFYPIAFYPDGLFLSKGHKKILWLLKRYVAWKGSLLPEGTEYSGISIRAGDLYTKRYRKVLGERIYVSEIRILSSVCTGRKEAIVDLLDQVLEQTKCKTPEELSIFLESAGF